ncbi:MAG: DapH/DapD/GlmU-related protein [Polyangiales bacterium]
MTAHPTAFVDPRATVHESVVLGAGVRVLGASVVGAGSILGDGVIIGHPAKQSVVETRSFEGGAGAVVGANACIRSGTIVYEGCKVGTDLQTGHYSVLREHCVVGDNCALGSHCVLEWRTTLGANARFQNSVTTAENSKIGANVFLGPHVSMTGGRYMGSALVAAGKLSAAEYAEQERAYLETPVLIHDDVRVGANAVLLAGSVLEQGCIVAAGAVVGVRVPATYLALGNPARVMPSAHR